MSQGNATSSRWIRKALGGLALPLSLSLVSPNLLAADAAGGSATVLNAVVGAAWTTLRSVQVNNFVPGSTRHCTAVGSSDALNPGGVAGPLDYRFTLSTVPSPLDNGPCERTLEFYNVPLPPLNRYLLPDNRIKEVTSTCFIRLPYGQHQIYWLAKKIGGAPNLTVDDSSMTVNCLDVPLPN